MVRAAFKSNGKYSLPHTACSLKIELGPPGFVSTDTHTFASNFPPTRCLPRKYLTVRTVRGSFLFRRDEGLRAASLTLNPPTLLEDDLCCLFRRREYRTWRHDSAHLTKRDRRQFCAVEQHGAYRRALYVLVGTSTSTATLDTKRRVTWWRIVCMKFER